MPRNLYTPSTCPVPPAPDPLLRFIQQAQLALVYSRRREGRLPLHDSFRLTLGARRAAVYLERTNKQQSRGESD